MTATSDKATAAGAIVKNYMIGSLVPGLIPVPWIDIPLIAAVQLKMLHRLAKHYETPFSSQLGKSAIASLVGGAGSAGLAGISAHFLKMVPVFGQFAGQTSMALFGAASTYAVGKVFIQHFETGGTLLTFNAQKVADYYREQFEVGRQEVRDSFAGVKP